MLQNPGARLEHFRKKSLLGDFRCWSKTVVLKVAGIAPLRAILRGKEVKIGAKVGQNNKRSENTQRLPNRPVS